ncbi:MAG: VCBS repeat-containing protein, partial [Verrucomicrobia bacterium]|nr:VCBS repeat-containing protein [Verrucomicrobiota bacterium]
MRVQPDFAKLPLYFEPNHGQAPPDVRFLTRQGHARLALHADHASLAFASGKRLTMHWAGAREGARLTGADKQPGVTSYFLGRDPSQWKTSIPHYGRVHAEEVYPGVDMEFYGQGRELEFDFRVKPGADPGQLRLRFDGHDRMKLAGADLVVESGGETVRLRKPVVYQMLASGRREVSAAFRLPGDGQVAFSLGDYDPALPLVVDPVIVFSTYLGGTGTDVAKAVTVDNAGNIYITGTTTSAGFTPSPVPTLAAGPRSGQGEIFVAKLNAAGTALQYLAIIGGAGEDVPDEIAMPAFGKQGDVWVTGYTSSADFPVTAGAFRTTPYATAPFAFVSKLNPTGTGLSYSTYLAENAKGTGIAVTPLRNVAAVSVNRPGNAGVFILNESGSAVERELGPFINWRIHDVSAEGPTVPCASFGALSCYYWVAGDDGGTGGISWPGAYQPNSRGGTDAFVARLDSNGNIWRMTNLGGTGDDTAVKVFGHPAFLTVVGNTKSTDFFLTNPNGAQPVHGGQQDGFVAVVDLFENKLIHGTFLGGAFDEQFESAAFAWESGTTSPAISIVGRTNSWNLPVKDAFQATYGGGVSDGFVSQVVPYLTGSNSLVYTSYLGGFGIDISFGVAALPSGEAVVVGISDLPGMQVVVPLQSTPAGGTDATIVKVNKPSFYPIMCVAQASGVPTLNVLGRTELTGDVLLICQHGTAGVTSPVDLELTLNLPIKSRLLNTANWASEALLVVDEPTPSQMVVQPVGKSVAGANVFQGDLLHNVLRFSGIPLVQPGANAGRVFRMTNVRADVSGVYLPDDQPYSVVATLSAYNAAIPIFHPVNTVGVRQYSIQGSIRAPDGSSTVSDLTVGCAGSKASVTSGTAADFAIRFEEKLPHQFHPRHSGIAQANADPSLPPPPTNFLGLPYVGMTGFYKPDFPAINGLPVAGLAQSGTRLAATFADVPAGTRIWVTTRQAQAFQLPSQPSATLKGFLTATDAMGGGLYTPIPSTIGPYAEVPISSGGGTAVWELAGMDNAAYEAISFGVVVSVPPNTPAGKWAVVFTGVAPYGGGGTPFTGEVPLYRGVFLGHPVVNVLSCAGGPVRADFDGNRKPDLVWVNDATRQAGLWYMGGAGGNQYQSFSWLTQTGSPGWTVAATADLDGNGKPDLIWQNDTTRQVVAWYLDGAKGDQYQSWAWLQSSETPGWRVVAAADLDGNGNPDLMWQND